MARDKGGREKRSHSEANVSTDNSAYVDDKTDGLTPAFCFSYFDTRFHFLGCEDEHRLKFLETLTRLSAITWSEIKRTGRHKMGTELIHASETHISSAKLPEHLSDSHFILFRYHGMRVMAGVRQGRVFHIFALEKEHGDIYKRKLKG